MAKIFIIIYSAYGHIATLAEEIKKGVEQVEGVSVEIYKVKETLPPEVLAKMGIKDDLQYPIITADKLTEADGYLFGIPTRYGGAPTQIRTLIDSTGKLWAANSLRGKFAGTFFSTGTQHGGQEVTAFTTITWFTHLGINYVPFGYSHPYLQDNSEVIGGSPWGAGTVTRDGSPTEKEKTIALTQGKDFATLIATYTAGKKALEQQKQKPTAYQIEEKPVKEKPVEEKPIEEKPIEEKPEVVTATNVTTSRAVPPNDASTSRGAKPTTATEGKKKRRKFLFCCGNSNDLES